MSKAAKGQTNINGPFEVVFNSTIQPPCAPYSNTAEGRPLTILPEHIEPERRLDCGHYETCLELAAALNWESFTCAKCKGQIDESLKWRAGQSTRKDAIAKAICGALKLSFIKKAPAA